MIRTAWSWTAEHTIPSDTHATPAAVADLLNYLQQHGWPASQIFFILGADAFRNEAVVRLDGIDAILTVHPGDFGLTGDPVRISAAALSARRSESCMRVTSGFVCEYST